MEVLIVEGRIHQFVTTDIWVRLCYVTSLATALSIPINLVFIMPKSIKAQVEVQYQTYFTALCTFNQ